MQSEIILNTLAAIIVATSFLFIPVICLLGYILWKAKGKIDETRAFNEKLQQENVTLRYDVSLLQNEKESVEGALYHTRVNLVNALNQVIEQDDIIEHHKQSLDESSVYLADALQELATLQERPLSLYTDAEIIAKVHAEVERRVTKRLLNERPYGEGIDECYKLASKLGGKCFRVVDKAKRGKYPVAVKLVDGSVVVS